jgi:hypothetical protein
MTGLDQAIREPQHLVATDKTSSLWGYEAMRLTTSLLAFTILSALAGRADAAGEIDIFESGANVVAAGAGVFDITDLTFSAGSSGSAAIAPSRGGVGIGSPADSALYGTLIGPSSLGSGRFPTFASSASGDMFGTGFSDERDLLIPSDYISGAALLGSATFDDQTIASLGLDPGTYVSLGQWRSRRQLDHQDRGGRDGSGAVHLGDDGSRIRRSRAHRLSRVA